jgi:hypothetical protein
MVSMSDKKQIMVRLDPSDYEKLRDFAHESRVPVAVLARNWITLQLGRYEPADELPEPGQDETPPKTPPSSSPGQRSANARRRKKKKNRR